MPSPLITQLSMGRPPPVAGEKRGYRAHNLRARLVCRLIWAPALSQGAPALLRRPSPSCRSRLDPRRRVDLLPPAPSLLFFSPSSSSFPHFLLPHRPRPARHLHAIRAPVPAEPTPSRTFLIIKWPS